MTIAVRILSVLLALVFLLTGTAKLVGVEQLVEAFRHFGYPEWFRLLIGAAEVAGGIGLLIPRLTLPAALGLVLIMAGAVWSHWRAEEGFVPPLVLGALLLVVAAQRRPTLG